MHPTLFYEYFFFCTRECLESLQLVRRSLRNTIAAVSNVLPLRSIDEVLMGCSAAAKGEIQINVNTEFVVDEENEDAEDPHPGFEASIHDGDFEETFLRLQNTCVKEFHVGIRDSPFLRYWQAKVTAVTVLRIYFGRIDGMDYNVLDSIVNHLRPRTTSVYVEQFSWHKDGNSEKLELLARESLLNNLQTCRLNIWDDAFPPPSFILDKPGYANYELWFYECHQVADGIDGLLESFVRDGCANQKLESMCMVWHVDDGTHSPAPKQLIKPTKTEMPLPKKEMAQWVIGDDDQAAPCEMYSFENRKQRKRMTVYKWSREYNYLRRRRTTHVLQCRVESF